MVRVRLAMLAACAAICIAACAVDSYLTCGAPCVEGGADVAQSDVADDAPGADDADDGGSFDGFPDAPVCDAAPPCFDASVPPGWTPVAFTTNGGGTPPQCAPGLVSTLLVYDPVLQSGACRCSACAASGSWSCNDSIGIGGASCDVIMFDASTSGCFGFGGPLRTQIELQSQRTGNPTCGTSTPNGSGKVTTSPARMCTPSACDQSVCVGGPFTACIYASGSVACPAGFAQQPTLGTSATLTCAACPTCGLANADAGCASTLQLFSNQNCGGTPEGAYSTQNVCSSVTTTPFSSVYDEAGVPKPNCGYNGGNVSGAAQLANPITVCCP